MTARLILKPNEERRLKAGHLWIYRDEIERLDRIEPGELVHVYDARKRCLGTAYAHPESKLTARMMSKKALSELKPAWWADRLADAMRRRDWLIGTPHYRLVHGEGDKLPGLIVDRFGDDIVVQAHTTGIERQLDAIIEAIASLIPEGNIYINNKAAARKHDGLESYTRVARGDGDGEVIADESGVAMRCQALAGQKTGYFYDQRPNRAWVGERSQGLRVLDLFSYVGAFSVQALQHEAAEVISMDASAQALSWAERNAATTGFGDRWRGIEADIMKVLPEMDKAKERFDIVICDPPAFVKSRSTMQAGLRGYQKLAMMATKLVKPGGMICVASCSGLVVDDDFRKASIAGIREAGRAGQIVYSGGAGPDHPWLPAMPETRYLKFHALTLD